MGIYSGIADFAYLINIGILIGIGFWKVFWYSLPDDSPCSVDFDRLSSSIDYLSVSSSSSVLARFTGSIGGLSGGTSGSRSGAMAGLLANEKRDIILMLSTPLSSTTFMKDSSWAGVHYANPLALPCLVTDSSILLTKS